MEIWRKITLLYSVNQLKKIEVGCHRARFFPTISYNFVLFVPIYITAESNTLAGYYNLHHVVLV